MPDGTLDRVEDIVTVHAAVQQPGTIALRPLTNRPRGQVVRAYRHIRQIMSSVVVGQQLLTDALGEPVLVEVTMP